MDRGEIWLVSLDPVAGHEQSGKRPVLIVSPASFSKLTRLPVVAPVTSPEQLIWLPATANGWNRYLTVS